MYAAGCTLRFPRICRVRDPADKAWDGTNTLADLHAKLQSSGDAPAADDAPARKTALRMAKVCSSSVSHSRVAAWFDTLTVRPANKHRRCEHGSPAYHARSSFGRFLPPQDSIALPL